jgi:uncharacterized membrane protein
MTPLILGLILFLGTHSVRIVADGWRARQLARWGELPWKGAYTLLSLAGFALIVWGYGLTRTAPAVLWTPPAWTYGVTIVLMVPAFILIAAAYVPGTRIKAAVGHPMIAGVKLWALAHLLSNGRLGDVVLFGAFLAWAVLDFAAARRRDRAAGVRYPAGPFARDAIAIVAGLVAWILFTFYLHAWLIGVRPLG